MSAASRLKPNVDATMLDQGTVLPTRHNVQVSPTGDTRPAFVYQHADVILSVPDGMPPRDLILALRELERIAIEDYLRRTADSGGT